MRVLITGAGGFVGKTTQSVWAASDVPKGLVSVIPTQQYDITDPDSLAAAIDTLSFDAVLHLAAQSNVPKSFEDPSETFTVNVMGTVHLLELLQRNGFTGRFMFVSSGDVYGPVAPEMLPVTEASSTRPANPYAASKLAAETAVLTAGRYAGFETLIARPLNHIGPGQSVAFAIGRFANLAARISKGMHPPVVATGPLDVTRDFLDVRDVVVAYSMLLQKGQSGQIYTIASEQERSLQSIFDSLMSRTGYKVTHSIDPALVRPTDLPRMRGSSALIRAHTGWTPQIAFEQTLDEIFFAAVTETIQ
jgi:GDP-4-dehydro-6-deoxy-D-mannose reductase